MVQLYVMKPFGLTVQYLVNALPGIASHIVPGTRSEKDRTTELDPLYRVNMVTVGMIRLQKEIKMLAEEPPPGVCAWPVGDALTHLQARESHVEALHHQPSSFSHWLPLSCSNFARV